MLNFLSALPFGSLFRRSARPRFKVVRYFRWAIGLPIALFLGWLVHPAIAFLGLLATFWAFTRLELGSDGFQIGMGPLRKFISYHDVKSIELHEHLYDHIQIHFRDGRVMRLGPPKKYEVTLYWNGPTHDREQLRNLSYALRDAHAEFEKRRRSTVSRLAREHEDVRAWKDRLTSDGGLAYRTRTYTEEELCSVLEDVGAPPSARAMSAHLLRKNPSVRPRIRIAAEHAIAPGLAEALEVAASENTNEEEALMALELVKSRIDTST